MVQSTVINKIVGGMVLLAACGCAAVGPGQSSSLVQGAECRIDGRIVHPTLIRTAQTVLMVPFSAGAEAAAGDALDQAALVMIRGMDDGFAASGKNFEILTAADEKQPDLIIKGRIQQMKIGGGIGRYFGGHRTRYLRIDGQVLGKHGEVIAAFEGSALARYQDKAFTDLALIVGKKIGEFLIKAP